MAAGSAGEGAGSNTELRWRRFQDERVTVRVKWVVFLCEMELAHTTSSRRATWPRKQVALQCEPSPYEPSLLLLSLPLGKHAFVAPLIARGRASFSAGARHRGEVEGFAGRA